MKILGLVGKKHSGKDTVCKILQGMSARREISIPVYRAAFADEVKAAVARMDGITVQDLEAQKEVYRYELQFLGSYRRQQNPCYWIQKLDVNVSKRETENCLVVITDVRFPNEAEYIQKMLKGTLVRIRRHDLKEPEDTHESEAYIEKIDCAFSLDNYGVWRRLETEVKQIVEWMKL